MSSNMVGMMTQTKFFQCLGGVFLEKEDDGKESIRKVVVYRERLFGPFESIEEWKEGIYLYIHESYHGYFGKDEEGISWQ